MMRRRRKTVDFLTTLERAIFTGFSSSSSCSLGFLLSLGRSFLLLIRLFVAVAAPLFTRLQEPPHQLVLLTELKLPLLDLLHLTRLQVTQVVVFITYRLNTEGCKAA